MTLVENLLIDGRARALRRGAHVRDGQSRERRGVPDGGRGGGRGRRSGRPGRCPRVRGLGRAHADPAREGPPPVGGPDRGARRGAGADRDARHGHGDRRRALVRGERRGGDALLRGRRGQVLRLDDPRRPGRDRAHVPRADRRHRAHHAVELPAQHRQLEDGAGARGGEHGGPQACEPLPSLRAAVRGARPRGRAARGRAQRRARAGSRGRRRARRAPARRQGRLHGVDRGRRRDRAQGRGNDQAGDARARRQERVRRVRGCRPREGRTQCAVLGLRERGAGLLRPLAAARRGLCEGRAARALRRDDARDRRRRPGVGRHPDGTARLRRPARDGRGVHRAWRGGGRDGARGRSTARTGSTPASTSFRRSSTAARTTWSSPGRRSSARWCR